MLAYRSSPLEDRSPGELLQGRRIRTNIPDLGEETATTVNKHVQTRKSQPLKPLAQGDVVTIGDSAWSRKAKVVDTAVPRSYRAATEDRRILRRNLQRLLHTIRPVQAMVTPSYQHRTRRRRDDVITQQQYVRSRVWLHRATSDVAALNDVTCPENFKRRRGTYGQQQPGPFRRRCVSGTSQEVDSHGEASGAYRRTPAQSTRSAESDRRKGSLGLRPQRPAPRLNAVSGTTEKLSCGQESAMCLVRPALFRKAPLTENTV
ncbi:hypothetical protein HPB47_026652 [Ixodes persulcatus]|uniref:Uncharacterized protein n=1 Tax=Ixodes persulcatus TaxID=34615 RepID=A0AC60PY46_IXOPE|nr:hypothetical protein HPB47_026652 [Ixodes persulcatus]